MKTRSDYMNGRCTHREYYAQFVTDEVRQRVANGIGRDRLRKSTDEHLNDIPLKHWDALFGIAGESAGGGGDFRIKNPAAGVAEALREAGDGPTAAGMSCIAKEAARQLREAQVDWAESDETEATAEAENAVPVEGLESD